jgi:hypothetical protein
MKSAAPLPFSDHQQLVFDGIRAALDVGKTDVAVLEIAQNVVAMLLPEESHQHLRESTLSELSRWFVEMGKVTNISDQYRARKMRMVATEVLRLMIAERPDMADHIQ